MLKYLISLWQQSPDMAKLEVDNLTSRCYALTNTPQITFEALQGLGNTLSGKAFKFMFMGTHMAVSNHARNHRRVFTAPY